MKSKKEAPTEVQDQPIPQKPIVESVEIEPEKTELFEVAEKKIVPPPIQSRATIETKPHAFYVQQQAINQKRLTDKEEYIDLKEKIDEANLNGKREIHYKGDLRDFAWQTLSQEGYRLQRTVNPENPNDINFYIRW